MQDESVPLRGAAPLKCECCGRFVAYAEVVSDYTPDSVYTAEKVEHYHRGCYDKIQKAGIISQLTPKGGG